MTQEADAAHARIVQILTAALSGNDPRPEWLASRAWECVPVESGSHLIEADAADISRAMGLLGVEECVSLTLDPPIRTPALQLYRTSPDALLEMSWNLAINNCVLTTLVPDFLLVFTTDEYYLVCGPRVFVEAAVGEDLRAATRRFRSFMEAPELSEYMRRPLRHAWQFATAVARERD